MEKPKFNKNRCLTCKYARFMVGGFAAKVNGKSIPLICSYGTINPMGETCLFVDENRNLVDKRGTDYNNCKLYSEGDNHILNEARRKKMVGG